MKKTLSLFLAFVLALGLLPMSAQAADPVTYKDSGGGYKLSQLEIVQLMQDAPIYTPSNLFKTEPSVTAPYAPGELSDEALNAALARVNLMRTLAGLPEVTLDKAASQKAQYGAVLETTTNGSITHTPGKPADMDSDFYQKGYAVTSTSSIGFAGGTSYLDAITSAADEFMQERGDNRNLPDLGHRAWMMYPSLKSVGIGLARTDDYEYFVQTPYDTSGSSIDYEFLAWPASGNFPRTIMTSNTPWSVALNPDMYARPQASQVTVTIKHPSDNKTWTFSSTSANGYFGISSYWGWENGAIVFRPDDIETYDGTYNVTISGIKTKSGQDTTLSYQVKFFNDVPGSYEIRLDDGTDEIRSLFTNSAGKLTALPSPTRDGYTFEGWYTEPEGQGSYVQLSTVFTKESTIYAKWRQTGTGLVSFDANGGTVSPESMTTVNYKLPSLPTPTRPGYTFLGWYTRKTGGSKVTTDTRFTLAHEAVYAHWQAQQGAGKVTITLDLNATDATTPSSLILQTDDKGRLLSYPMSSAFTRPGYVLKGWRTAPSGGTQVTNSTIFTTDTTIYAQWVKSYKITCFPNLDGRTDVGTYYTDAVGYCFDIPFNFNHSKYTFLGWYTAPTGGTKIEMLTVYTADTTLYAHWANTDGTPVPPAEQGQPVTPDTPKFADVAANAWYANAVAWAVEKNITVGTSATTFSPNDTCTQGQILTFLWRSQGEPAPAGAVSGTQFYAKAAQWAKEQGLTDNFSANAPCTRAMVVTYLWKLAGSPKPGASSSFVDVPANLSDAVSWAAEQNITAGTSATTFSPDTTCTRGQIVTFLHRAYAK